MRCKRVSWYTKIAIYCSVRLDAFPKSSIRVSEQKRLLAFLREVLISFSCPCTSRNATAQTVTANNRHLSPSCTG